MAVPREQERFEAAVKVIETIPKNATELIRTAGSFQPSYSLMLKFYAYFKQATQGQCSIGKPAFYDVVGKAKWNAWQELGDMDKSTAMNNYVEELKKVLEDRRDIVETMPHTPFVENFIEKLGHFYELVDEKGVVKFPASLVDLAQPTLPNGDLPSQSTPRENGGHHFLKSELETDASTAESDLSGFSEAGNFTSQVDSGFIGDELSMPSIPSKHLLSEDRFDETDAVPVFSNGVSNHNGNGHISKEQLSRVDSDSDDGDEFLDTSELLVPQHIPAPEKKHKLESRGDGAWVTRGGGEVATPDSTATHHVPSAVSRSGGEQRPVDHQTISQQHLLATGGDGSGGREPQPTQYRAEITEQIAVALVRLQQDMNSVLTRLNTLENLTVTQNQISRRNGDAASESRSGRSWWPFHRLGRRDVFLVLVWPFIVHALIRLISRRHRRHR